MAALTTEATQQILEVCKVNAGEAGGAFSRAFGGAYSVAVGEPATLNLESWSADFAGPGLACLLKVSGTGAVLVLSEAAGMIPEWYAAPDASGSNKLYTLALELSMTLLPETFVADDYQTARVEGIAAAVKAAGVEDGAGAIPLTFTSGEKTTTAWLLWPLPQPEMLFVPIEKPVEAAAVAAPEVATEPPPVTTAEPNDRGSEKAAAKRPAFQSLEDGIKLLPPFTRSLLKVRVPVLVTLATTKMPVNKVIEIVPGTIIQFNKSCEEMLTVEVGDQRVAEGEAVKVGDKFGLRITSIAMPEERFFSVRGKRAIAS